MPKLLGHKTREMTLRYATGNAGGHGLPDHRRLVAIAGQ
jgi:hypothetical protein